ncbi:MAG: hypothetical protein RBT11_18690 [Desulfobacterales bacterium]|jgi:hypothetical protein|nr:hypothetical protein [Desulfobacterales bacterium]
MKNVVNFPKPKRSKPRLVDWARIEALRQQQYAQIPAKAVAIIRRIHQIEYGCEERTEWNVEINFEPGPYPPETIESSLKQTDIIWVLDLLDRFGGELICGEEFCTICRPQIRLPAFWIKRVDPEILLGMDANSAFLFDHYFEARNYWRILGKKLPDSDLIMINIRFLADDGRRYIGFADSRTFSLLLDRIEEGTSIEKALQLDQIC